MSRRNERDEDLRGRLDHRSRQRQEELMRAEERARRERQAEHARERHSYTHITQEMIRGFQDRLSAQVSQSLLGENDPSPRTRGLRSYQEEINRVASRMLEQQATLGDSRMRVSVDTEVGGIAPGVRVLQYTGPTPEPYRPEPPHLSSYEIRRQSGYARVFPIPHPPRVSMSTDVSMGPDQTAYAQLTMPVPRYHDQDHWEFEGEVNGMPETGGDHLMWADIIRRGLEHLAAEARASWRDVLALVSPRSMAAIQREMVPNPSRPAFGVVQLSGVEVHVSPYVEENQIYFINRRGADPARMRGLQYIPTSVYHSIQDFQVGRARQRVETQVEANRLGHTQRTYGQMLNEYMPSGLLRQEMQRRDTLMDRVAPGSTPWSGGVVSWDEVYGVGSTTGRFRSSEGNAQTLPRHEPSPEVEQALSTMWEQVVVAFG